MHRTWDLPMVVCELWVVDSLMAIEHEQVEVVPTVQRRFCR
jgi:hypothetical protein